MVPRGSTLVLVTASIVAASSLAFAKEIAMSGEMLPAPSLVLTVAPGSIGGAWKMKVENTGEVPVRIPADPHVLSLEITPAAPEGKIELGDQPSFCFNRSVTSFGFACPFVSFITMPTSAPSTFALPLL